MIDLHAHILPGLDDGAKNLDESLGMALVAAQDGISTIVATPHTGNGTYDSSRDRIFEAVAELNSHLREKGIPVTILPGADIYVHEQLDMLLRNQTVMTVNDNMHYVMVEFPRHVIPPHYLDWMFRLTVAGFIPILTHPERNTAVHENTDIVRLWVEKGGLVQITAMSLIGAFGSDIKKCTEELLRYNLVHAIASDAHSPDRRPPVLSEAVNAASALIGPSYAGKLVEDYPAAIIAGKPIYPPEPIAKKRGFFAKLLSRRET